MINPTSLNKALDKISGEENKVEARQLISEVLQGLKDIANGLLRIGIAAGKIKDKKYYREMGYSTFEDMCNDIFKLTRKTVNLYLRIVAIQAKHPNIFTEERIATLGSAKMEKIISGDLKMEKMNVPQTTRKTLLEEVVKESIDDVLSVSEVYKLVKTKILIE
jgi:hypothetical protein